ncbi:beta-1,3-galactosyltransferase 5-like [Clytia hemisphaerica]|uniref:beta-1,3-galactosyltransferase 5-like n=1 Tax=Clytia hemisphaerica TaxID=252671 RepID=UPI0034D53AEB
MLLRRRRRKVLLIYAGCFILVILVFLKTDSILNIIEKKIISCENFRQNIHRDYKLVQLVIPENNTPNIKLLNYDDIDPFHGDIMFLVTSHIRFQIRRDSIRSSWGDASRFTKHRLKYNGVNYKVYFQTGYLDGAFKAAKLESKIHRDMLISNRTEDYWDLSRRVMLGFIWSLGHCSFEYLIKTDDDVFYNIPNLFQLIYEDPFILAHKDRVFAGSIYQITRRSSRDLFSKWYVPKEEWPADEYPYFATGMANILSRLVVERMRPHFDWVNPFRLDDVYIGMLVNRANVPRMGIRKIKVMNEEFYGRGSAKKCFYLKHSITQHQVTKGWCMEGLTAKSVIT